MVRALLHATWTGPPVPTRERAAAPESDALRSTVLSRLVGLLARHGRYKICVRDLKLMLGLWRRVADGLLPRSLSPLLVAALSERAAPDGSTHEPRARAVSINNFADPLACFDLGGVCLACLLGARP